MLHGMICIQQMPSKADIPPSIQLTDYRHAHECDAQTHTFYMLKSAKKMNSLLYQNLIYTLLEFYF